MCVFVLDPGANTSTFGLLKIRGRHFIVEKLGIQLPSSDDEADS
jgi:hypothetical protein